MLKRALDQIKRETFAREGSAFPSKTFSEIELAPAYDDAKTEYLDFLRSINLAHVSMLTEESLITPSMGREIAKAVLELNYPAFSTSPYTGRYEDLYFEVESQIIAKAGPVGGYVHLARSRNDIGCALQRMMVRQKLLSAIAALGDLMTTIAAFSQAHRETLMIAHTHTQQAQPTRMGHYFLGIFSMLNRDMNRLHCAYETANQSPMGAAAITTSGFRVNRQRVSDLLGFTKPIENSYDAISGFDYLGEAASAVALSAVDLGKLVSDMMLWVTQEFGILRLQDAYVQCSSIMPQKRNPSSLEHVRSLLSTVSGAQSIVFTTMHNTPYGDIVDSEDDMNPFLNRMLKNFTDVCRLLSAIIATMEVNLDTLEQRADESFSVVTELADTLVRETGLGFRQSHSIVSKLVKQCVSEGKTLRDVTPDRIAQLYEEVVGEPLKTDPKILALSLSADHFCDVRDVLGGTSQQQMELMLSHAQDKLDQAALWLTLEQNRLATARETMEAKAKTIAYGDLSA